MSAAPNPSDAVRVVEVAPDQTAWRLDRFLVFHFPEYSRVLMRNAITSGGVLVDGRSAKPAYRLNPGQTVSLVLPDIPREAPSPEDIPLDVLFEDDWVVAVNKPPGMVVHPARGHWSGTLASALQFRFGSDLSQAGGPTRPGIVHRLDRDTSGVILVARNDTAHARLSAQFEQRRVEKEYFAVAYGSPLRDRDWIDAPIGPHPSQREKKAICPSDPEARTARTFYEVERRFDGFAAIRAFPKTGRTHQIRLHLTHIGLPIAGDLLYSSHPRLLLGEVRRDRSMAGVSLDDAVPLPPCDGDDFAAWDWDGLPPNALVLERQALHARKIRFFHPRTEEPVELEAPLPQDLRRLLFLLDRYR